MATSTHVPGHMSQDREADWPRERFDLVAARQTRLKWLAGRHPAEPTSSARSPQFPLQKTYQLVEILASYRVGHASHVR